MSEPTADELFAAYQKLGTITAVAKKLNLSYSKVQRILTNHLGYRLKRDKRTVQYLASYALFRSLTAVADEFDVNRQAPHQVLSGDPSYTALRRLHERVAA